MKSEMTVKLNVETLFEGKPIELEFVRDAIREKRKAEGWPEPIELAEVADNGRINCEVEAIPGPYEIILGIDKELTLCKKAMELMCEDLCPDREICPLRQDGNCTCCAVNYYLEKAEQDLGQQG